MYRQHYFFYLLHQTGPRCCFLILSLHSPLIIPIFYIYLLQPELLPPCADTVAASTPNELSVEPWAGARAFSDLCWELFMCQGSGTGFPPCRSRAESPLRAGAVVLIPMSARFSSTPTHSYSPSNLCTQTAGKYTKKDHSQDPNLDELL